MAGRVWEAARICRRSNDCYSRSRWQTPRSQYVAEGPSVPCSLPWEFLTGGQMEFQLLKTTFHWPAILLMWGTSSPNAGDFQFPI